MSMEQRAADELMQAFAEAIRRAAPDSPVAAARARIGDRFYEVACNALKANAKRALTAETGALREAFAIGAGRLATQAWLADVIAGSLRDLSAAA